MHLFGVVEARGTGRKEHGVGGGELEGSFSCAQPAGGTDKPGGREEGDEERRREERRK